jgi:hypothetical protein
VNTDAQVDPLVRRRQPVPLVHPALDFDGTAPSVYRARELDQDSVTRSLNDTAAMFGDFGFEELAPVRVEALQRALFVCTHEPAVADDIAGEDGSKPAFDSRLCHEVRPDLFEPNAITARICDRRNGVLGQVARQQSQAAHVRFVPKADIRLFDHLVCAGKQRLRNGQTDCLGAFEIDH